MKQFKKYLSLITLLLFTGVQLAVPASAFAAPELPEAPSSTEEAETPERPENYEEPEPEPTSEPVSSPDPTPAPTPEPEPVVESFTETPEVASLPGEEEYEGDEETYDDEPFYTQGAGDGFTGGGDVEIDTGDANSAGQISNIGNTNLATGDDGGTGGIEVVNDGNGTESDNTGSVSILDSDETNQVNDADLDNSLRLDSVSGDNSASENTGVNSEIDTGNANTTGTIFNSVNTNVDGLTISEFNIFDDQAGDYVLDFGENCIAGCDAGIQLANTDNGSYSTNTADLDLLDESVTFQQNDADVVNELILTANSGDNSADNNTGGDSSIGTGNANVVGNVLNFLNNNFAGNVVYGVVNIFGDMTGDLVIPEDYLASLGLQDVSLENSGNGTDSDNLADVDSTTIDTFSQFNTAEILNNIDMNASTGDNHADDNTGGSSTIDTGNSTIDGQVLNIANTNVVGGNWWLVLVNDAGNWMGHIIGLDDSVVGNNYAASNGTNFADNGNGVIDISNDGNGAHSDNTGDVAIANTNETTQINNANIVNNIVLDANTGGNSTSRNTGGNNDIDTGNASAKLNLVNFVNNNFVGGNVFLTVVNVFGDWFGDVLTPGAVKQANAAESNNDSSGIGGSSDPSNNSSSSHDSGSGSDSDSSDSDSSNGSVSATVNSTTLLGSGRGTLLSQSASTSFSGDEEDTEEIALATDSVLSDADSARKVRLNFAWGLLLIPAYFGFTYVSKKGLLAKAVALLKR